MRQLLDARRIYELDPSAYLFWLKFRLELGRVVISTLLGSLVALVTKRYELPAAATLAVAQIAMFCTGTITLIASGRHWLDWFLAMATWNVSCAMATFVGGVIVRKFRSSAAVRVAGA